MEELSFKEFKMEEVEVPTNSLPPLSQQELLLRGDYRGHGDPVEPAYEPHKYARLAQSLSVSDQGIESIKCHEGFVAYFYGDQDGSTPRKRITEKNKQEVRGLLTIGYGFRYKYYGEKLKEYFTDDKLYMTEQFADQFLREIIHNEYEKQVRAYFGRIMLTQHQFDAIVSISYNMGTKGFAQTKAAEAILGGNITQAAKEIPYAGTTANSPKGLADRRNYEQALFQKGIYQ